MYSVKGTHEKFSRRVLSFNRISFEPQSLYLPRSVCRTTLGLNHFQHSHLGFLNPSWTQMVDPRKLEPKRLISGMNQGQTFPSITTLGSSLPGFTIQVHLEHWKTKRPGWQCMRYHLTWVLLLFLVKPNFHNDGFLNWKGKKSRIPRQ